MLYLCTRFQEQSNCEARAFSSAGLEHLPYKQRVGGSNPSTPTQSEQVTKLVRFFVYLLRINTTNHIISQKNYTQIKTYL